MSGSHAQTLFRETCFQGSLMCFRGPLSCRPVHLRPSIACQAKRATTLTIQQGVGHLQRQRRALKTQSTYPEPETEKERSSVDIPQEWITPQPSRRPDVLPEFEKLETPPPRKMPGDPEQPDEEEEEEEKEKEKPEEDPEEPEQPPEE